MKTLTVIPDTALSLPQLKEWEFPQGITKEEWANKHKILLWYAQAAKSLIPKSRAFCIQNFGEDHMLDTEAQFILEFGITLSPPKESAQKEVEFDFLAKNITRWVSASVEHFGDMESWDRDRLTRALELLTPMEAEAARIRKLLGEGNK